MVVGAVIAGYQSGRSDGSHTTRLETQQFLIEFARSTDLESYLKQRGEQARILELTAYGIGGPRLRSYGPSSSIGILCVAVGIIGLLPLSKRSHENRGA